MRRDYPELFNVTPNIKDSYASNLADYTELLVKMRITPVLIDGTLLGWYRECGFITHTSDLDTAVLIEEYSEKLVETLKKNSHFKLIRILGIPDRLEFKIISLGRAIDLHIIYHNGTDGFDYTNGLDMGTRGKYIWRYPRLTKVCTGDLKGHLMFVPCNVEEMLTACYGNRWDVPHLTWNYQWWSSGANVEYGGEYSEEEMLRAVKYL
uniref:LicD family protein n=1 Tax=Plectus sambesii TaxID=2011161 RepID=A0A914X3T2_9BILA